MLGGKVGWGAVRADNEGQTLAGIEVEAGGWMAYGGNRSGGFNTSLEGDGGKARGR